MGEAKRRKQLGLMPQIENHDVTLHRDGSVSDHALPGAVMQRLKTWAETGERWDARYRTSFIGTGAVLDFSPMSAKSAISSSRSGSNPGW